MLQIQSLLDVFQEDSKINERGGRVSLCVGVIIELEMDERLSFIGMKKAEES